MDEVAVLVLNHTFEPLHFTNARRAITLLLAGKAESVEGSPRVIRSPSRAFPLPAVIRLAVYIRKPFLDRVAFNKKNILRRDGYTCQYCNRRGERLTVDPIVPRSRGGETTWINVVAACLRCNLRKGNRLPDEAGMLLCREPVHPKFVSYYDYYQSEAYIPQSDTYIEKDALVNDEIDRMRHSATKSLLERRDVVVVASVSCIYGIGEPDTYQGLHLELRTGERIDRDEIIRRLVAVQYERNDYDFHPGTFRVRGDVVEIFPANEESLALRVELFGDEVDALHRIDPLKGSVLERLEHVHVYPASHYVTEASQLERALATVQEELGERLAFLRPKNRLLEAQRLEQRTLFDMEMLRELGYCHGIENYSRHLTGRRPGEPPPTLIEYLPKDALIIIDESHVAVPQIRGMFYGDRSRKEALVEYGFRLPSAFDNRPLTFDEFTRATGQTIYVSATPSAYELELAADAVVEQVIRPTGLMDPKITVRPATDQVDDLLAEVRARAEREERVLVTTLTKRMAEDLTEY